MAADPVTGTLRFITAANTLVYFAAAMYHSGLVIPAGALAAASIAEALLGFVLLLAFVGVLPRWPAYLIALAGTLFGLTIVLLRGLLGVDLWIHVVMLAGLAVAFLLLFSRRASPST
jgi:hypothetical protein